MAYQIAAATALLGLFTFAGLIRYLLRAWLHERMTFDYVKAQITAADFAGTALAVLGVSLFAKAWLTSGFALSLVGLAVIVGYIGYITHRALPPQKT